MVGVYSPTLSPWLAWTSYGLGEAQLLCTLSSFCGVVDSGGGALRYQMATRCQTAVQRGSGEHQNIGAVNSFEGKKGGGGHLQTKNQIRVVTCKMCLFVLYFVNYMIFMCFMEKF